MIVAIKSILLLTLTIIFIQDFKQRKVWAFLFPIFAFAGGYLFYDQTLGLVFLYFCLINLCFVGILILAIFLFSKFVFKKKLLNESLGLGDILFFIGFALSFPTIAFINFFVFALLFTFVVHFLLKKLNASRHQSVPLAGCMAFFLIVVYTCYWIGLYDSIYLL